MQVAHKAGFCFRVKARRPRRLAEEIDGQRGFAQIFEAKRAAALEVFTNRRGGFRAERPQQVKFVELF